MLTWKRTSGWRSGTRRAGAATPICEEAGEGRCRSKDSQPAHHSGRRGNAIRNLGVYSHRGAAALSDREKIPPTARREPTRRFHRHLLPPRASLLPRYNVHPPTGRRTYDRPPAKSSEPLVVVISLPSVLLPTHSTPARVLLPTTQYQTAALACRSKAKGCRGMISISGRSRDE
jgi:hypothetical protein